ncbi:MAG: tetratricopeptide repeat protein [Candidatus Omnitrophota bacterium]
MKERDERYVLENRDKKSVREISQELNIPEKRIRKLLKKVREKKEIGTPSDHKPALTKRRLIFVPLLLIIILGCLVYMNSLKGEFVWDDGSLIVKNAYVRDPGNAVKIFTRNIRAGAAKGGTFYRPMQIFSYMIDYAFWKLDVRGYHITNTILHVAVALLIYWLICLLYNDRLLSFLASAFYVVHPVHTEAVAYISGRADSLVAMFMILAFIFYIRYNQVRNPLLYICMILSYAAALTSRENSLILPLALLLYHYSFKKRVKLDSFLAVGFLALGYIALRMTLLKSLLPPYQYCPTTFIQRLPGFFVAMTNYVRVLLFPFNLHMEYGEKVFNITDPRALLGILIAVALLTLGFINRRRRPILSFSIFWFFLLLIPSSNLLPINAYMAEHWLYIPSIGFFLVVSKPLSNMYRKENLRNGAVAIIILLIGFYSFFTIKHNAFWRDPITFYERTLEYAPDSAMVSNNLGEFYHRVGRDDDAIKLFKRAIEIDPLYAGAYSNLANSYKLKGDIEGAIRLYQKALELRPDAEFIYYNLGLMYNKTGRKQEAISLFNKAIELNPEYSLGYNGLGVAYFDVSRGEEAVSLFKKAISLDPGNPELYHNLGVTYIHIGKLQEGIDALKRTIEIDPTFAKAYKDLSVVYINKDDYGSARKYYEMAKKYGLSNPAIEEELKNPKQR